MDFIWEGTNAAIKHNSKLLEFFMMGSKKAEIKVALESIADDEFVYKAACDEIERNSKNDFTLAWHFEAIKSAAQKRLKRQA